MLVGEGALLNGLSTCIHEPLLRVADLTPTSTDSGGTTVSTVDLAGQWGIVSYGVFRKTLGVRGKGVITSGVWPPTSCNVRQPLSASPL